MDRLVCGDVGYGKTEIAVRAAFKAVQDGKQVAVLVPTTLLVQQHFSTFAERMRGFPVVAQGAVAVPDRQGGRRRGHRGPGRRHGRRRDRHPPAAQPRGPGQEPRPDRRRRGAAVRRRAQGADEAAAHLRRRAVHVGDPDPAHAGDGDHRHPGDVHDRHPAGGAAPGADLRRRLRGPQVTAAIRRELLREGQVFYIHNRVQSIEKAAARLRELVPRPGSPRRTGRWASTSSSR